MNLSIENLKESLRTIMLIKLLILLFVFGLFKGTVFAQESIYNNGNVQNLSLPIGLIPPFNLTPPQEIMDWDSTGGGTVKSFQFAYYTPDQNEVKMNIRFYTGTNADSNGTLIAEFLFTGLPNNEAEHIIDHDISDSTFFLPPGPFGYSYEILDSLAGPIFSMGEKGSDSLRSVSQNKNFSVLPGIQNQLHMVLGGSRGLLAMDHSFEGPGVIQVDTIFTYNFKIPAPLPPPPDPFINMEGFIGIKTDDPIKIELPDGSTFILTGIDSSTIPAEKERLSGKFGKDPINFCSEGVWQCAKIDFGNGFTFETEIFTDGFETGDITSWATGAVADNSTTSTKETPVGVLNEDKKLPVLTAEELAEAIKLLNEDDVFDSTSIGLVSERFGVLEPLPPAKGTYFFDEFESFRKVGANAGPPVTIDGSNCQAPCDGLVLQGGNGGINNIRIENFPGYGVVIESDGNRITNMEIAGNGMGGLKITGNGNSMGGVDEGNQISDNGGAGVLIESGTGNEVIFTTFLNNAGLGIDLGGDGLTPNDTGDSDTGANNLQNFPELTNVESGPMTLMEGTLNSTPNTPFTVELFANDQCDPSGNGEGAVFLGSTAVGTNGNGDATFSFTSDTSTTIGQFVTATATDAADNTSEFSECFQIVTSVEEPENLLPTAFALSQNYPNPFNPATQIKYDLPGASNVRLTIYNFLGQSVRTLVDAEQTAGFYSVGWDGRDDSGVKMPSGVYIYRLEAGQQFVQIRKMILLK